MFVCLSQLANLRPQFLLDRLGRCLKLFVSTESTSCHELASQFGLEFFMRKTLKTSGKPGRQCQCLFQWPATSHFISGAARHGWVPQTHLIATTERRWCVWVCARVRTHACACVRPFELCLQYTIIIFYPG